MGPADVCRFWVGRLATNVKKEELDLTVSLSATPMPDAPAMVVAEQMLHAFVKMDLLENIVMSARLDIMGRLAKPCAPRSRMEGAMEMGESAVSAAQVAQIVKNAAMGFMGGFAKCSVHRRLLAAEMVCALRMENAIVMMDGGEITVTSAMPILLEQTVKFMPILQKKHMLMPCTAPALLGSATWVQNMTKVVSGKPVNSCRIWR